MTEPAGGQPGWIVGLRHQPAGGGQLSSSHRFHLDVHPDSTDPAPPSAVLKMAAGTPEGRGQIAPGYRGEVGYYTRFAPTARIRVPPCRSAAINTDGRSFTLVLEDAHPARPGIQTTGGDIPQAEAALRNLAGLHGPFWNKPGLTDSTDWLRQTDEAALSFLDEILTPATEPFLDRFQDHLSPTDTDTPHRTAPPITSPNGAGTSAAATPSSTAATASTTSCSPNPTR